MAMPPCAAGEGAKNPSACNYTALWNLLDFPAGVLPAYTATADDVGDRLREWRRDEGRGAAGGLGLPNDPWGQKVGAASGDADVVGLPIGVQVVAPPWQEELCLRAMRDIEEACPSPCNHQNLSPVPRRSPEMGARPQEFPPQPPLSRL